VKVAPAVERAGIHLGVWRNGEDLEVWGTVRTIPALSIVVEVAAPGLLVVKHHRGDDSGKFVNVAVLEGDQIKVVDEQASSLPDCPPLLSSLLGFDSPASWAKGLDSVNVLVQLAVSMRAHGRGGLMLIVPAGDAAWQESIVRPIPYAVAPAFGELKVPRPKDGAGPGSDAVAGCGEPLGRSDRRADRGRWRNDADHGVRSAGVRAKIARRKGSPQVEQVTATEPIEGNVALTVHPTQLGGTRHLSAAQFVPRSAGEPSRWSRRRTAASLSSPGLRARAWSTHTGSRRCSCNAVVA